MAAFEEPTFIWIGPVRSWQGRSERLQVEVSEYNGRPTVALRLACLNAEGQWRWAPARQSSSGRAWAALSLRRNELAALGQALIQAANELEQQGSPGGAVPAQQREQRSPRRPLPREQRALDAADCWPAPARGDDDLPF